MKVYDAKGMLLGRLATRVAKAALLGEKIAVVNCEQAVVSGKKVNTLNNERAKPNQGGYPLKSPKLPRLPDRFVRRSIRGMLPHKQARGLEAYKRVMCYRGLPAEFENEKLITVEDADVKKLPNLRSITVGQICKNIGGKE